MSQLNGFFALRTPRDLRDKLEVDFNRLTSADQASKEAQYAAFDFFVCAEHLPDWLCKTVGGSRTSHRSYPEGALVSHIANGAKHFRVEDPRHTTVKDTIVLAGAFQASAFQCSTFQVPRLMVELENGSTADVVDLATKVIEHWRKALP